MYGVLPASTVKKFKVSGLDLVQKINNEQNANLKENEIELIQDRTQFCFLVQIIDQMHIF